MNSNAFISRMRHPLTWIMTGATLLSISIGYRGLSLMSHAHLGSSHDLAVTMSQGTSLRALHKALATAHPHLELISALTLRTLPGDHGTLLSVLSWLALMICLLCIWRILMRHTQGNQWAAAIGAGTFTLLPATVAHLGTPSPTLMTCACFLATWDLCTLRQQKWWQSILAWLTGALLLGSWSPMLLWACLLLLAHLMHRAQPSAHDNGLIPRSSLPAGVLLCVPMVPLCATLLHPGFLIDIKQGWLMTLDAGWLKGAPSPGMSSNGHWFGQGKLSWLATWNAFISRVPLVTLMLGLPGVLALIQGMRSAHGRLLLMSLPAMTIIMWATPAGDYGQVEQSVLTLSLVALLVGHGFAWCTLQAQTQSWHRLALPALATLAMLAPASATLSFWSTPAAWQSSITGGAVQAQQRGDSHNRHLVLPRAQLIEHIQQSKLTTLHAGKLNPIVRTYDLDTVQVVEDPSSSTARLGFTPRFAPDAPKRPEVMTYKKPLIFLGKPAAPSFYLKLPE